jgi:cobalt-zinc-cadmium resistance protein CzcA
VNKFSELAIPLAPGGYVPLSEVVTLDIAAAPNQISREIGKRRIAVTDNVRSQGLSRFRFYAYGT